MRLLHWIIWHCARLWHVMLRMLIGAQDEWAPGMLTDERTSWEALRRHREKRKTGRPTSRVAIAVKPRVKPAAPAEPEKKDEDLPPVNAT